MIQSQRSHSFGRGGGTSFDDSHVIGERGRITQIVVRHGTSINGIGVVYQSGHYQFHGGTGGSETTITLAPDEYIKNVRLRSGNRLDRITFVTNQREHGPYGDDNGDAHEVDFEGGALHYIFGRSNGRVHQLGFAHGELPPALPHPVFRSNPHGGERGGEAFDDLRSTGYTPEKISAITICSGGWIDKIIVNYGPGRSCAHGGSGGTEHRFALGPNEWVTRIVGGAPPDLGMFAGRVNWLQFFLNSGRVSPVYGSQGTKTFDEQPVDQVLKAIYGRAGGSVDQIGFYFEEVRPTDILITSLTFDAGALQKRPQDPIALVTKLLTNDTSVEQEVSSSVTVQVSDSETTSISESHKASVKFKVKTNFLFKESELELGYEFGHEVTTETTRTISRETSFQFTAKVPAHTTVRASCIARKDEFDLPWTATAEVTYPNQAAAVTETLHGVLRGVQTIAIDAKYEEVPSGSPPVGG